MFSIYLIINGIEWFLIEQIRVDAEYNIMNMQIKQSEIISVAFILTGIFMFVFFFKKNVRKFRYRTKII
jgi:prolipoprotein diacylglyceryltransferase